MATMEKPKQKKKKKVKSQPEIDSIVESLNSATFQSTSSYADSIQSVECTVASQIPTIPSGKVIEPAVNIESEEIENEIEIVASAPIATAPKINEIHFIPTAPILQDVSPSQAVPAQIVMFPDLKSMEAIEYHAIPHLRHNLPERVALNIQPFNELELNQIYTNSEIHLATTFEAQFIDTELKANYTLSNHVLFEYLKKYSKSRTMVKNLLVELETLRSNNKLSQSLLWAVKNHTGIGKGTCSCGAVYSASHIYSVFNFDENEFTTLSIKLKDLYEKTCYDYVRYIYDSEVNALHIEQYLRQILAQCNEFRNINSSTPISINTSIDEYTLQPVNDLRRAVSILFYFLRQPIPDKTFFKKLKKWLKTLISLHIRVASWQDHVFLLFHILRSPSGTSKWMSPLIQIPDLFTDLKTPFSSNRIDHCVTILKIILLPIKQRNDFLKQLKLENVIDPVKDDVWTIIDSDGEEGTTINGECIGLKESDLVALLNQIPFENLMRILMCATLTKSKKYDIDEKSLTGSYILKLFAFSTGLVKILGDGLMTYSTERYRQFAKRLARLVRHVVLYVTDVHELFINQPNSKNDVELVYRIQIEYNSFILRTCHYMYNSRSLGTWQYLVDLPFSTLDERTLWILFYCLMVGFPDNFLYLNYSLLPNQIENEEFLNKFNNIATEIAADDLYYLLQTFCNMILSREKCDWKFIQIVTVKIFEIGFVNQPTKDICYKLVRDLLFNISDKYPELMSHILWRVKLSLTEVNTLASYLFKTLPINKWKPSFDDFEILSAWLLNFNIDSIESSTARVVISYINWGFDECDKLFLSHEIHIRMACLICQVSSRHVPEVIGASSITESVRQMSNFYSKVNQTLKQQFTQWCWNLISRLRLHCMDQGRQFVQKCIMNPVEMLKQIPELERIDAVFQGVSESRPLALYVSILISMCGHSVPEICHKGFLQLHLLLNDHKHMLVIRCLQLITPLFLECPESLYKSEKFQSILTNLLTIDRTYYKMTKELISAGSVGLVVELLGNMIQAQIIDYVHYGLPTPTLLINLWLHCLTNNLTINWIKDWNSTFLIDLILKIAFQFSESWNSTKHFFKNLYTTNDELLRNSKSSSFSLFGGSSQQFENVIPPEHSWLGLMSYEIEHELFEAKYWPEFLRALNQTNGRNCVDVALKKATSSIGCNNATSAGLVVFKLANYIYSIPLEHPTLPVITQSFFKLYLARIPLTPDEKRYFESLGVTNKFFEQYSSIFRKLKKRFIEIENYYKEESLKESNEIIAETHMKCSKLFGTFTLWLEEQTINKMDMHKMAYTSELPPKYDSNRLKLIFNGSSEYWYEFMYMPLIRDQQKYEATKWLKECFRFTVVNNTITSARIIDEECAKDRIIKRLQSYDQPEPPPGIPSRVPILNDLPPLDKCIDNFIIQFGLVKKYSKDFCFDTNELQALDATFKDKVRVLYETKTTTVFKSKVCSCKHNVPISIQIQFSTKLERVQFALDTNRERYDLLLEKQTISPPENLVLALAQLSHYVRLLVEAYKQSKMKNSNCDDLVSISLKIFYDVILGEPAFKFIPATDMCTNILINLADIIKENQDVNLLKQIIKRHDIADILLNSFDPLLVTPRNFIKMYTFVVELFRKTPELNENYLILCKFELKIWLNKFKPRLVEITQLIELIMNGIENSKGVATKRFENQFCSDLINLFEHNFPEHYGEILEVVLKSSSEKQISPNIMLELLNSLYKMCDCEPLRGDVDPVRQKSKFVMFANKQKLFTYKEITETISLLANFYQTNRLKDGLHGLYPNHTNHCDVVALMFGTFTHSAIVSLICTYPGVLANQLIDWLWPVICDLYSPWLVTYSKKLKDSASSWLKHATSNDPFLFPCNISHVALYQKMFCSFISSIQFCLEMLPGGIGILNQIFYWYEIHFANTNTPKHVLNAAHGSLMLLPWNKLEPNEGNMESFNRLLLQFLPECHVFVGHIYINIDWVSWLSRHIHHWNYDIKHRILSYFLMITVKLSFEPTLRENKNITKLLDDVCKFPWHLLEYQSVEGVLNWFVLSTEPSVVLKLPSDGLDIDIRILILLQYVCGMKKTDENTTSNLYQSKRIIYVRTIVRILRICGSKYQKLLSTNEGVQLFNTAFIELLTLIESVLNDFYNCDNQESINLLIEIVDSLQIHGEMVAKLFVDAISIWQNGVGPGNVLLCCTLNAIGNCKMMSFNICSLLESTINNYFKTDRISPSKHNPEWSNIVARIGPFVPQFDGAMLLKNHLLLDLHLFSYYNLKYTTNIGDKISYLNKLHHWIVAYKSNEMTEAKLVLVWGLAITCAVHIFQQSYNSKNSLLVLARYFQVISTQSEGWGEGLLGVIGLKKDGVSNKRRILTRCLACLIFSLFPEEPNSSETTMTQCKEYASAIDELKQALTNRKYNDVRMMAAKSIDIIERFDKEYHVFKQNLCTIIRLYYDDPILSTVEDFWNF